MVQKCLLAAIASLAKLGAVVSPATVHKQAVVPEQAVQGSNPDKEYNRIKQNRIEQKRESEREREKENKQIIHKQPATTKCLQGFELEFLSCFC
jgi:hypothetical protein